MDHDDTQRIQPKRREYPVTKKARRLRKKFKKSPREKMAEKEGAKVIPLTQGRFAIVDEEDYNYLNQWVWCVGGGGCPMRNTYAGKEKRKTLKMHRCLLPEIERVDHANRDKLDNRKSNLRSATRWENGLNCGPRKSNPLGYKGVYQRGHKFVGLIRIFGVNKYLGTFATIKEASDAYLKAARKRSPNFGSI